MFTVVKIQWTCCLMILAGLLTRVTMLAYTRSTDVNLGYEILSLEYNTTHWIPAHIHSRNDLIPLKVSL